ncbi:MAG TPA: hypothetical protein VFV50_14360 [Bdellovibrionales bacterium]|nr:hypothetical protein [Bdellovibrionales bacterium]
MRNLKRIEHTVIFCVIAFAMVFLFQNCGPDSKVDGGSATNRSRGGVDLPPVDDGTGGGETPITAECAAKADPLASTRIAKIQQIAQEVRNQNPAAFDQTCLSQGGNNSYMVALLGQLRLRGSIRTTDTNPREYYYGLRWENGVVGQLTPDVITFWIPNEVSGPEGDSNMYVYRVIANVCGGGTRTVQVTDITPRACTDNTMGTWTWQPCTSAPAPAGPDCYGTR